MREGMTGDVLFAQVLFMRGADTRTILIVEGDTDSRALDPHVDSRHAVTIPGFSKRTLKRALELVDQEQVERVLALFDRDFVDILEAPDESANAVYTDDYDLIATIAFAADSECFTRVVTNLADRDKQSRFCSSTGRTPMELVLSITGYTGLVRYLSARDNLGVRTRRVPIVPALDTKAWELDIERFAMICIAKSKAPQITAEDLASLARAERSQPPASARRLSSGHDIAPVLAALIARWGGSAGAGAVEFTLRAALGRDVLVKTQLFRRVASWASERNTRVWAYG